MLCRLPPETETCRAGPGGAGFSAPAGSGAGPGALRAGRAGLSLRGHSRPSAPQGPPCAGEAPLPPLLLEILVGNLLPAFPGTDSAERDLTLIHAMTKKWWPQSFNFN